MTAQRCILETERLWLREMTHADLDFMAELLGDAEVMRYYPKVLTRDEAAAVIELQFERYRNWGFGNWLVLARGANRPIGRAGLLRQEVNGQVEHEIGYMIHRPFWRQGYATEAALGIRQQAFEERGQTRLISLVRPENVPSQGVARKMGATIEQEVDFKGYRHYVFVHSRPKP